MVVTARLSIILAVLLILTSINADMSEVKSISEEELAEVVAPYITNEKYIREIHSMMNTYAYKGDTLSSRMLIEMNDLIDSKTGKRNADLINSILALPKGMNEAGR